VTEEFNKELMEVYNKLNLWTDNRGYEFLRQLILSGDVFLLKGKGTIIKSERDYDRAPIERVEISEANLWCYEGYRGVKEIEKQNQDLRALLRECLGFFNVPSINIANELKEKITTALGDGE
jgi:hypothetical protein